MNFYRIKILMIIQNLTESFKFSFLKQNGNALKKSNDFTIKVRDKLFKYNDKFQLKSFSLTSWQFCKILGIKFIINPAPNSFFHYRWFDAEISNFCQTGSKLICV